MINSHRVAGKDFVFGKDGKLIPLDHYSASDLADDEMADDLVADAIDLQNRMDRFKEKCRLSFVARQRRLLPPGTAASDEELVSRGTAVRSICGKNEVLWVVDRKVRVNVAKLSACKAALAGIVESIPDKVAKKAVSELLNLKSDRSIDASKLDFLTSLEVQHEGWDICLEELRHCFEDAGQTAYPRCYQQAENGRMELIPLRVSGGR